MIGIGRREKGGSIGMRGTGMTGIKMVIGATDTARIDTTMMTIGTIIGTRGRDMRRDIDRADMESTGSIENIGSTENVKTGTETNIETEIIAILGAIGKRRNHRRGRRETSLPPRTNVMIPPSRIPCSAIRG